MLFCLDTIRNVKIASNFIQYINLLYCAILNKIYDCIDESYLVLKFLSMRFCTITRRRLQFFLSFTEVLSLHTTLLLSSSGTREYGALLFLLLLVNLLFLGLQKYRTISFDTLRHGLVCFQEWSRCQGDDCIELLSSETSKMTCVHKDQRKKSPISLNTMTSKINRNRLSWFNLS